VLTVNRAAAAAGPATPDFGVHLTHALPSPLGGDADDDDHLLATLSDGPEDSDDLDGMRERKKGRERSDGESG
jgi:hypothetical protein